MLYCEQMRGSNFELKQMHLHKVDTRVFGSRKLTRSQPSRTLVAALESDPSVSRCHPSWRVGMLQQDSLSHLLDSQDE